MDNLKSTRILLAGDVHGNEDHIDYLIDVCKQNQLDTIIQLGDFGYWEHIPWGKRFLDHTNRRLDAAGVELVFVDGNHENHEMLRERQRNEVFLKNEPLEVRDRITWLSRGYRWEMHGHKCLALGGAYSIDKPFREAGRDWWPEELITDADVGRSVQGGRVDIMFTHDAPPLDNPETGNIPTDEMFPPSLENRKRLAYVVEQVQPKLLVHGHWHRRNSGRYKDTRVEGFDCDGTGPASWGILDLETLEVISGFEGVPAPVTSGDLTRPAK